MVNLYCTNDRNCIENIFDARKINDLQYFQTKLKEKNWELNNAISEKNDLQQQLLDTSTFINNIIEKHEAVHSQLSSNYDMLWYKYQSKSKNVNQSKSEKECLIDEIEKLNNKCEEAKSYLKMQNDRKKCLEEEKDDLERSLYEEKENVKSFKCKNQNQLNCLEKKSDDLSRIKENLNERIDELKNEKIKNRRLELQKEDLSRKVEKMDVEDLKLKISTKTLKSEIDIKHKQNVDLGQVICDQKCQLQELKDMLQKRNQKNDELKHLREKEKIEANSCIGKIRDEKLCVESQREELECMLHKQSEELKKVEQNYEDLMRRNKDLQCKLDAVVRNSDEQKQWSCVQVEKLNCDKKQLQADLCAKDRVIKELEEKLCNEKNRHKAEVEYTQKLRFKLESLKLEQKTMPNVYRCTGKTYDSNKFHVTDTVYAVLKELKLDCDDDLY